MMGDFHFLRPGWLIALPLVCAAAWWLWRRRARRSAWFTVVEQALQPYVLVGATASAHRLGGVALAALAASLLAVLALSGPTWNRAPVPAARSGEALVVAVDLSRSMDAADVAPSRLGRAKLKLLGLLERRQSGQTALVVFSAHAFTVTPLTTDVRTISALVTSLSTDLMPSRGSYPEAGLQKAAQLLRQAGIPGGEILLISDADVSPRALDLARELRAQGMRIHVLAVGTEEGAPIADAQGGFVTNASGEVVVPRLRPEPLRRLAGAGGGRFSIATPDDTDLDRLFGLSGATAKAAVAGAGDPEAGLSADVWYDQGRWLALALLPLLAVCFRRGWIAVVAACLWLPTPPAQASVWSDLWQRPDQQAATALAAGDAATAADLFEDPRWRAAARYRAGAFTQSAGDWAQDATADGHYNRGNALARAGQFQDAIDAYEQALELDPAHADARYNLDLLRESGAAESEASSSSADGSDDSQAPEQAGERSPSAGSDGEGSPDSTANPQDQAEGSQSNASNEAESSASDVEQTGQGQAGPPGEEPQQDARPEDAESVEEWASEQAADQWLRRIPQDPGGLLRRKFLYQYQRLGVDQDGNYVWPGDEAAPW